ncbi:MAG: sugar phosphate isomerase/epimerase [Verrucomicrobia bacterium]|nr:sugar phosphate isomerase/epimerase [Verrucomicrobiota bacterium]
MKSAFRPFLWIALVAAWVTAGCSTHTASVGTGSHFRGPVGIQLYSLRAQFTRNVPQTIGTVKGFGIQEVELAGNNNLKNPAYRQMLEQAGLKPIAGHFPMERITGDTEAVAKECQDLGIKYVGAAWIKGKGEFDIEAAHKAAADFNKAGKALAAHGIKVFYHCHGYEFKHRNSSGLKAMDILIRETDSRYVAFEMDILWVQYPGEDPAAWLAKYPGRWELMHLKDLKKGVPTGFHNGGTDPNNDVALGTGQMDWSKILKAAQKAGVKHYFIEDESASSVEQIPQSLKFLESVRW